MQTILHDGVSFLSEDDGEAEIMDNVNLETIQRGSDRYNAAFARISEHHIKEKVVVAKSLQKDGTYLLPAQVDLSDINAAIATMEANGWKSTEIMEVSAKRCFVTM